MLLALASGEGLMDFVQRAVIPRGSGTSGHILNPGSIVVLVSTAPGNAATPTVLLMDGS